ncbi:unnamed protein product, partial [Effrenium voratum]
MGSGCFKASAYEPLVALDEQPPGPPELQLRLSPVLRASTRPGKCSVQELDVVLQCLEGPEGQAEYLVHWAARQTPKARSGLVALLQRALGRVFRPCALAAAEALKGKEEGAEGVELGKLAALCEDALRLGQALRSSTACACKVLSAVAHMPGAGPPSEYVVQDLDSIVLLFQRAFIGQRANAAKQLHQLRELEAETGLPPVQEHLALLGGQAKGLLLGMLLVPEDKPPCTVVLAREGGLADVAGQLPESHTSILLPYFEDATGTKTVQGRRVEGGEGHGLRKEFFTAMSADAQRRWGRLSVASDAFLAPGLVVCTGNRIKLQALEAPVSELHQLLMAASNGDRLKLIFGTGQECERIVTGSMPMPGGGSSVTVDKAFEENWAELTLQRCEVQKPALPLFEFHRGTGQQWFSSHGNSLHDDLRGESLAVRYRTFGKLLALAVANHCKLAFALPLLFFQFLLQRDRTAKLDDLKGFDNALHASLRKVLKMKPAQFKQIKELEGRSDLTREDYVAEQVKAILCPEGLDEVRRGFWSVVRPEVLQDITPPELRQIVCPTVPVREDMSVRQIFRVVFEDDVSDSQPLVEALYAVLDGLSKTDKKKFLMFVTGIEVPPEPGTEQLTVQMPFSAFSKDEHVEMLGKLPQAHTCTNTLELPNYYESLQESGRYEPQEGKASRALMTELKSMLKERLCTAINETDSYELDATGAGERCSTPLVVPPPPGPWAGPRPVTPSFSKPQPPALELSKDTSRETDSSTSPSTMTRLRVK